MSDAPPPRRAARFRWFNLQSLSLAYAILLALLLCAMEWWAEYWLPLGILLFAPPWLLLAPLGLLGPLALWFRRWRVLALHIVCVFGVLFVFAGYRLHSGSGKKHAITVITHNIGQGNRTAFVDAFPDVTPDVVILQDVSAAAGRERDYQKRYPTFRNRGTAQFLMLTPHEIVSMSTVPDTLWRGRPVAARYVIRDAAREFAVYCVHLPTPRTALSGSPSELLGLRDSRTEGFPSTRAWFDARMDLARKLAAVFRGEKLPFIVGGDFNMPDHGVVYHTFTADLTDAHAAVGHGWGMTFPGGREGRLARIAGHWLRLDYWFAGHGWQPAECRVAADAQSQHRAVLARFEFIP